MPGAGGLKEECAVLPCALSFWNREISGRLGAKRGKELTHLCGLF